MVYMRCPLFGFSVVGIDGDAVLGKVDFIAAVQPVDAVRSVLCCVVIAFVYPPVGLRVEESHCPLFRP